ncbi:hypothetical protein H9X85_03835 [Anaerotignum lactatifermentans]|uniref:CopG family transcriptional regulator n=1 Tax=Anaerotignum lactatifermentans TaxID=160404 RepID=A0ABS2G951_9FIRM|nr:hypothetical protein [Anaerotignum lactatifermentans]MBM6828761.1 hypothetical protein [Anaerotignum lactatifermentans]MBM6877088.1 hypothetical protein [Anaerotignum lactatifermentans]MBM6950343.1 hypothetical protein [Anaerotignum lactatifermentans]
MSRTAKFSREQLAASQRFREDRDLLLAVLAAEKQYTREEAEEAMAAYRRQGNVGKEK